MEPKQQPPYPLRMPPKLRSELEARADAGKRSLNAEIVAILEQAQEGVSVPVASLALAQMQAEVLEREWLQRSAQLQLVAAVQLLKQLTKRAKVAGVELSDGESQVLEELRFHASKIAVDQDVTAKRVQMKLESAAKRLADAQELFSLAIKR